MILTELFENSETVINERSRLVFSRKGNTIQKHYRCASGRIVSSPGACPSSRNLLKKRKKKLTSKLFKKYTRHKHKKFRNL